MLSTKSDNISVHSIDYISKIHITIQQRFIFIFANKQLTLIISRIKKPLIFVFPVFESSRSSTSIFSSENDIFCAYAHVCILNAKPIFTLLFYPAVRYNRMTQPCVDLLRH